MFTEYALSDLTRDGYIGTIYHEAKPVSKAPPLPVLLLH